MGLTREEVAGIAAYVRIALDEAEVDAMCAYLNDALGLLQPLLEYDLDSVEPTFHPIGDLANVVREDEPVAGLSPEEALANAVAIRDQAFRVPAILADGGVA